MLNRTVPRLVAFTVSSIGPAHPDVAWGSFQAAYRGLGWAGWHKLLPMEALMVQGGSSCTSVSDRVGYIQDPEDPRHPIVTYSPGGSLHHDGSTTMLVEGTTFNPISEGTRLLQLLYDSYLEPFSMHRPLGISNDFEDCPNHIPENFYSSVYHLGQTSSIVGRALVCVGCTIGEGVTIKADVNDVYIQEGCQIMDNVCIVTDRPTNLHYYQRREDLNPYQTFAPMEGTVVIRQHSVIEPNVMLESCMLGMFNRIGHGAKIMKGVTSGEFVHVLPGSVVIANTKMKENELWGGAPAQKLGKVNIIESKRKFGRANLIRDFVCMANNGISRHGDQSIERMHLKNKLDKLVVEYEEHVTDRMKQRIEEFIEGREPWNHKITRLTQGWTPSNRGDDRNSMMCSPMAYIQNYSVHNCDSFDSKWHGTGININNYIYEYMW